MEITNTNSVTCTAVYLRGLKVFLQLLEARASKDKLAANTEYRADIRKKYTRVCSVSFLNGGDASLSAYCFIDQETGDIYKANGTESCDTTHRRGNIYHQDPLFGTNLYGVDDAHGGTTSYEVKLRKEKLQEKLDQLRGLSIALGKGTPVVFIDAQAELDGSAVLNQSTMRALNALWNELVIEKANKW